MTAVKVTNIGNSKGIILPKEILALLNADTGDNLYITRTPKGIEITPYDDKFVRHMEAAEHIMREDRDVLRRLAE